MRGGPFFFHFCTSLRYRYNLSSETLVGITERAAEQAVQKLSQIVANLFPTHGSIGHETLIWLEIM